MEVQKIKQYFKAIFKRKSKLNINGQDYAGNNVVINSDGVFIDDVKVNSTVAPNIKVSFWGDCTVATTVSGDIAVTGNCNEINTVSGDVQIEGNANGDIETLSGDVRIIGSASGKLKTMSGDIKVGSK